jgi:hypothetical protein
MAPTTAPAPADPATVAFIPPESGAADMVTIPILKKMCRLAITNELK